MFSEVVWELERPRSRTRQRNMRSCRNSLEAAFRNVDAYDLVDAYDHAEKVISDLAEGADYFQELVRRLMVEAALRPWDEFLDFLDRFERDFKKQLTADNVERHRQYIRETLNRLHGLEESKFQGLETQLNDIARWAQDQRSGDSTYRWLLQRIEELVEAACTQKLPELIKAMNDYLRRAASIVQQAFVLRGGQHRHAYARAITKIASLDRSAQDKVLERIGREMASAELRFVDPQSFKLRTASERRKALTVTRVPKVSRQARLNAAVLSAEASAFALSNEDVVTFFRSEIRLLNRPLRLSTLPLTSAIDVLRAMQAVEAIRGSGETGLKVTRLPTRLTNPYYSGFDYQIELLPSC